MEVKLEEESIIWEGYVNWKKKPATKGQHGGMLAASFVLVVEVMESLAFLACGCNLVVYLLQYMHYPPSEAANNVTNFMGTAFLLALLGGFLSDAFFITYKIYLMSALVEFLGLAILTTQSHSSWLMPPECNPTGPCEQVNGAKAAMLFVGLYATALGVGCIKGCLPAHGAQQFDETTINGRKQLATFFNYFVFCLSFGALLAVTLVVWIEDNKGWDWGLGIATLTILLSIPVFLAGSGYYKIKVPYGSPFSTIFMVFIGAIVNRSMPQNDTEQQQTVTKDDIDQTQTLTLSPNLKFLNNAAVNKPAYDFLNNCSIKQVEDVKIILQLLPIFGCTIMLNCCIAQLFTFSIQQAASMNTKIGSLNVPPASLPAFPVIFIIFLAPLYDHIIIPVARKVTKSEMGVSHLQRIGVGLLLSVLAMAIAALVEIKRKRIATRSGLEQQEPLPITFLWVSFQYLFLGSADLFTLAGSLEFFYTETPETMKSLATSLSFVSLAMGYYLSTVIVSIVNGVTGMFGHRGWLSGENLNHFHLERFYWLICILSALNFLFYLYCAKRYKYQSKEDERNLKLNLGFFAMMGESLPTSRDSCALMCTDS
ncbi:hypothetical protein R6Q57_024799 [Mikania cordata]